MPASNPVLIISQSGRAMAKSAGLAGIQSYVMDMYADTDTREISLGVKKIPVQTGRTADINFISMLDEFCNHNISGVILGSGFEDKPDIYCYLDEKFKLLGNSHETVKKIRDPAQFFPGLQKLGISYPPVTSVIPENRTGWLAKKTGGCGGTHIKPANGINRGKYYFQKFVNGQSMSAVFLAFKDQATLVGISETWCRDAANLDFTYAGAVTRDLVDTTLYARIGEIINLVTGEFQLKGLCGIDFIIDESCRLYVLEVNPRPVATFELHEKNTSLIGLHIDACQGIRHDCFQKRQDLVRACKIVYADADFIVPEFSWPEWTTDRPVTGSLTRKGDPVCCIHAEHSVDEQINILLQQRAHQLFRGLGVQSIAA